MTLYHPMVEDKILINTEIAKTPHEQQIAHEIWEAHQQALTTLTKQARTTMDIQDRAKTCVQASYQIHKIMDSNTDISPEMHEGVSEIRNFCQNAYDPGGTHQWIKTQERFFA